ncbi:pectinesterase family protein [Plebeiibacterium sediminum]|uniref:Pectinesterase n=1 Tax=Plebeiibacterium sediminum TaxID=2992112 RepID=A0AAE3M2G9_9BACT|nr:pectinesterase family protein [Plebeiobacterium sediminum]MCW3785585.1 pectinesterase family protein [Plebeiobacterium sediminum]
MMKNIMFKYLVGVLLLMVFNCQMVYSIEKIIVAKDGTGNYSTIQDAINSCKKNQTEDQIIFIKDGVYVEKLVLDSAYTHLHFIGESKDKTVISYGDHVGMEGITTANSYTFIIKANYTKIENLTIENSAGDVGQALAIYLDGDCCSFWNCKLLGNQDTVYNGGKSTRQYFYKCYIEGTTDFIFGSAAAVFHKCVVHSKKNSYITAANTPQGNSFGLVFIKCKLTSDDKTNKVNLGRPWRDYAQTVFIRCKMGSHILPEGWHNWSKPNREKTAFYAEYKNYGPGAINKDRVKWSHQLTKEGANSYTLSNIFRGKTDWIIR